MKSQKNIARYLFSLILAAAILPSGFDPSGYARSRHLIPSPAAPHPSAVQSGGDTWKSGTAEIHVILGHRPNV